VPPAKQLSEDQRILCEAWIEAIDPSPTHAQGLSLDPARRARIERLFMELVQEWFRDLDDEAAA